MTCLILLPEANCDNKGVDCAKHPNSGLEYWNVQPAFPTSELTLLPTGDKLTLIFRALTLSLPSSLWLSVYYCQRVHNAIPVHQAWRSINTFLAPTGNRLF